MYIYKKDKFKLYVHQLISFVSLFLIYFSGWIFIFIIQKYKISNIRKLRKQFQVITKKANKYPLLICPNHLTYIDSLLLIIICNSFFGYLRNFNTLVWNFPKINNVKKNWFYRIFGYLGKCIFINFEKPNNNNDQIINIAKYLLSKGQYIMLFPEGHRSKNGKIDLINFTYGVGKLVKEMLNIKVLCVYLRGNNQIYSSNYPIKGEQFYCKMELFDPLDNDNCKQNGLKINTQKITNSSSRIIRNISKNIIEHLAKMEQNYFNIKNI